MENFVLAQRNFKVQNKAVSLDYPDPKKISSKKIHSLGGRVYCIPRPIERVSKDEFVVCPRRHQTDRSVTATLVNTRTDESFNLTVQGSSLYTASKISENVFVGGSIAGHVALFDGRRIKKLVRLFNGNKSATLVQYVEGRVYAIAEDSNLTVLDTNLHVQKVFGKQVEGEINNFLATSDYVAYSGHKYNVTVHDNIGSLVLEYHHGYVVSSICIEGQRIASGSWDESCEIWSIVEKTKLYKIEHNSSVNHTQLFPDGSNFDLITSSRDQTVKVWKGGKLKQTLKHSNYCYTFQLDSKKQKLAVAYSGGVTIGSTAGWKLIADKKVGEIMDLCFNEDSNKILAAEILGDIYVIDLHE